MRILVDYRPALRARTGVGEYVHELVRAYASAHADDVAVFTSSWKDRPAADTAGRLHARVIDRRMPVGMLNYFWHRTEWPPIEALAGRWDVVHAAHPLLIPARHAAQVVTIHDLFFLTNPAGTQGREIARDYPALVTRHAQRADAVVAISAYTAGLVSTRLGVPPDRVYVCPPGAPAWRDLGAAAHVPRDGYLLFVGTLEPRKNVGVLLEAYARLATRTRAVPPLVLAGGAGPGADTWLRRLTEAPLAGRVRHLGYVPDADREAVYAGARALVLPSLDEGFGLPALEAMAAGIPVVVSNRGALPEVVGDAGLLVDPTDADALAAALERILDDDEARARGQAGLARARAYSWPATAARLRRVYTDAVARRAGVPASGSPDAIVVNGHA